MLRRWYNSYLKASRERKIGLLDREIKMLTAAIDDFDGEEHPEVSLELQEKRMDRAWTRNDLIRKLKGLT